MQEREEPVDGRNALLDSIRSGVNLTKVRVSSWVRAWVRAWVWAWVRALVIVQHYLG